MATSARADEPHSAVDRIEVTLGSVGEFTDDSPYSKTNIKMLVDPQSPSWTWKDGKLIVPACDVTLGGSLTVHWSYGYKHNTSALHWTLGSLGGYSMPIAFDHPNDGPGANVLVDASREKTWHITIPLAKGKTAQHLQAWTSKKGEKSQVKSLLFVFECEELPPPVQLKVNAAALHAATNKQDPKLKLAGTPKLVIPQLEVRRLRVDVGLPDANAIEWFKGQPTTKELLFHEASGAAFERGGAQWGVTQTISVDGQSYQSRGIDSCTSALKLNRYVVGARNNSTVGYSGASAADLKVSASGANGASNMTGKVGAVPANTESSSMVNAASSGFVFFPSGSYTVSAELVGPAASTTPANNSTKLDVVFKCRPLNSTTWN